jgi:hypothetical protein
MSWAAFQPPKNSFAGIEKFLRVDGFALDANFVMQMRPGRPAGRAELADDPARAHGITKHMNGRYKLGHGEPRDQSTAQVAYPTGEGSVVISLRALQAAANMAFLIASGSATA